MDRPLQIILSLLLFPLSVYLFLFPPRAVSWLAQAVGAVFTTPIDVDRLRHAVRKRTLRPDPFGDGELEVWTPSPVEQLMTRTLLLRSLPPELVLHIIDLARYQTTTSVISVSPKSVANGAVRYLASGPLPSTGRLAEVRIALRGHDQGWSSFPHLHGTYDGSSSYYELYLLRPIASPPADPAPTAGRPAAAAAAGRPRGNPFSFAASSAMDDDGAARAPAQLVEVAGSRRTIQYNVHAGQYYKVHLLSLLPDDPTLRLARPGDVLALDIVAKYQGWVNAVSGARITTFHSFAYGPPRDEDGPGDG